ncbi:hypothetical protein Aple_025800 [Acrocarpospora pleiomorpha]|uniref:Bacterial bifunctional deaminase-reductase C-terminal domain-containing protein n=1 Tax=Acrocarpospora pleiomorpha TaxID=90975 RepID=A0A5M3XEI8_9ACTN|nr:dihydrofolate reductase family protein [Acrocarpospora pleiomorpha]GES19684.1 hypothetical protein Aple_025800 [Acrocarpospora pleiomorpha]
MAAMVDACGVVRLDTFPSIPAMGTAAPCLPRWPVVTFAVLALWLFPLVGHHDSTEARILMGRIVVTEYISVDGVIEAPSGTETFKRAGWIDDIPRGAEGDQFKADETLAADAQLLGRTTYEAFAAAWPQYEGELADKFNSMPKYVVSTTLKNPQWNNTTVIGGNVVDEVAELKQRFERDILVHGSARLAQMLIEHDLVDALHLLVYPVIVGAGKRLFDDTSATKRLRLAETRNFSDGVHLLVYERAA